MKKETWLENGERRYKFDFSDITTLITCVAVAISICGYGNIATPIFIVNCVISIIYVCLKVKRFNLVVLNVALLIFNISFMI